MRFAEKAELLTIFLCAAFLVAPLLVAAAPFGGQTQVHHYCYNQAIYALLGPPRGGPYIWTPSTRTYQFGPPRGVGQWLLGLTGPPYYCVVTRSPIFVKEGISIMMMGSSGAAAPAYSQGGYTVGYSQSSYVSYSQASYKTAYAQGSYKGYSQAAYTNPIIGHMVVSEVFYSVDTAHGTDPTNEWIELYNGSQNIVDISGWTIGDEASSRIVPQGVNVAPGKFVVLTPASSTIPYWDIPSETRIISFGALLGNGLSAQGDTVVLKNQTGTAIDALSWGTNVSAFTPSIPTVVVGHSIERNILTQDTNTRAEWVDRASPTPGR